VIGILAKDFSTESFAIISNWSRCGWSK